jgi:hypothetical protein
VCSVSAFLNRREIGAQPVPSESRGAARQNLDLRVMIVAQPLRKELLATLEQVLDKNNYILLARTQAQSDV